MNPQSERWERGNYPIERSQRKKNEGSFRDLWDNMKHNNICTTVVLEGEETETESLYEEIMVKTSLTWSGKQTSKSGRHTELQIRGTQRESHTKTRDN